MGNIEIKATNKYSIITVVNWDKYQEENGKRTSSEQQTNNKTTTEEQQPNNKRTQHKNGNNGKNEKEIYMCPFFDRAWELFPNKKGKSAVSKKAMRELAEAGETVIIAAIENYKAEIQRKCTEEKYILHGSTFFNGRWRDYVSSEPEPIQAPKKEVQLNEAGFPVIDFGLSKYGDF